MKCIFALLFLFTSHAYSIESNDIVLLRPFSFGPLVGVASTSNGGGTNTLYGAVAGYKFSKAFGIGAEYQGSQFSVTSKTKTNSNFLLARAAWFFEKDDNYYLGVKIGTANWTKASTVASGSSIAAGAFIGADFSVSPIASVGAELGNIWITTTMRNTHLQLTTNFKLWF